MAITKQQGEIAIYAHATQPDLTKTFAQDNMTFHLDTVLVNGIDVVESDYVDGDVGNHISSLFFILRNLPANGQAATGQTPFKGNIVVHAHLVAIDVEDPSGAWAENLDVKVESFSINGINYGMAALESGQAALMEDLRVGLLDIYIDVENVPEVE
jgi:hypothetical protein